MALRTYDPHGDDDLPANDLPAPSTPPSSQSAVDLVRSKLARVYAEEPDANQELVEADAKPKRSKHQEFMYQLGNSGKNLAQIQTEWHNYYQNLPDSQKHQVWQEFYDSQALLTQPKVKPQAQTITEHKQQVATPPRKLREIRDAQAVKTVLRQKISKDGRLKTKHHLQSLLFGLGMGAVVILIFLFGFFNEVIITPFIQPSRADAATPIILSTDSVAPTATPEVIIPKINVEIPVDFSETSTDESTIENDLQSGIVHYPTTVLPGQTGNAAFFGHSSNNIFNKGKYKFAFVLLHTLVNGDTFYLTYNGKVYVYKVISHIIVDPSDVGVLGPVAGQAATATLITCDPPGTSLHRLVVVGQQISPDPAGNAIATMAATTTNTPSNLPGNGPTVLTHFIRTTFGKIIIIAALIIAFGLLIRWVNQPVRHARKLGL